MAMGSVTSVVGAAVGTYLLVLLVFRELARPAAFSGRHSTRPAVLPRFRFVRHRRAPRPA